MKVTNNQNNFNGSINFNGLVHFGGGDIINEAYAPKVKSRFAAKRTIP